MDWQPIDTAPKGVKVRVGKFTDYDGGLKWRTDVAHVWELNSKMRAFPFLPVIKEWELSYEGRQFTHWQPLPEPPTT